MIVNHRPSILKRPLRPNGNMANVENSEKEHEKEQARIRSHSTWQTDTQERMRKAFYAAPDERQAMQQEMSTALEQQMAARRAEQQQRALQERQCFPDNHTAPVPQDRARPWAATTQQLSVQEEAAARKRANTEAQEQNWYASAARASQEQQLRQQELAASQRDLQAEDSYWNRGATSAKWVPPEHRPRGGGGGGAVHTPNAPRPAPYTWDEQVAASRPRSGAPAPALAAPYSTHTERDMTPAGRTPAQQASAAVSAAKRASPAPFWTQEDSAAPQPPRPAAGARPESADRVYPWSWST